MPPCSHQKPWGPPRLIGSCSTPLALESGVPVSAAIRRRPLNWRGLRCAHGRSVIDRELGPALEVWRLHRSECPPPLKMRSEPRPSSSMGLETATDPPGASMYRSTRLRATGVRDGRPAPGSRQSTNLPERDQWSPTCRPTSRRGHLDDIDRNFSPSTPDCGTGSGRSLPAVHPFAFWRVGPVPSRPCLRTGPRSGAEEPRPAWRP